MKKYRIRTDGRFVKRPYRFVRDLQFSCHPERRKISGGCFSESNPTLGRATPQALGSPNEFPYSSCGETAECTAIIPCLIVGAIHESPVYENQIFYRRTTNGRPYGIVRDLQFSCHPERSTAESKFCDAGAKPRSVATMGSPNDFRVMS